MNRTEKYARRQTWAEAFALAQAWSAEDSEFWVVRKIPLNPRRPDHPRWVVRNYFCMGEQMTRAFVAAERHGGYEYAKSNWRKFI